MRFNLVSFSDPYTGGSSVNSNSRKTTYITNVVSRSANATEAPIPSPAGTSFTTNSKHTFITDCNNKMQKEIESHGDAILPPGGLRIQDLRRISPKNLNAG